MEWVYLHASDFSRLSARLDEMLEAAGRLKGVRRSLMTGCEFGKDGNTVRRRASERTNGRLTPQELRQKGVVIGTPTRSSNN